MDASNGTHRCRCGRQWTQAMAPTDVVVGYTYIFMIFESSSHNRSSSGQRSIYSARSSSRSTSRNNTCWLDGAQRLSAGGPLTHPKGEGPVNVGQALGFKRIAILPTLQQRPLETVSLSSTPCSPLSNTPLLSGVKHAIHTCIWEMHHASKSSSSHALSAAMVYNELESIGGHLSGHNRTFMLESV